jgi:hypothetical protein
MTQSNNNLSMINLLFFLGISLSQVSAMAIQGDPSLPCSDEAKFSQCCVVAQIYNELSQKKVYVSSPTSCCTGYPDYKPGSIRGVTCLTLSPNSNQSVIQIDWNNHQLNGSVPHMIGKLTSLRKL